MLDELTPIQCVGYAWLAWLVSWLLASVWRDRAVKRPATSSEILYRALSTAGGVMLIGVRARFLGGSTPRWRFDRPVEWVLAVVACLGFALTWWARVHLGRMWSSSVTRKADHRVIATGPYALVRHPIYSGVLLAAIATAALRGTLEAAAGAGVLFLGFYVKGRLEERFLRDELGSAYDDYARRVPMLVPFTHVRPT